MLIISNGAKGEKWKEKGRRRLLCPVIYTPLGATTKGCSRCFHFFSERLKRLPSGLRFGGSTTDRVPQIRREVRLSSLPSFGDSVKSREVISQPRRRLRRRRRRRFADLPGFRSKRRSRADNKYYGRRGEKGRLVGCTESHALTRRQDVPSVRVRYVLEFTFCKGFAKWKSFLLQTFFLLNTWYIENISVKTLMCSCESLRIIRGTAVGWRRKPAKHRRASEEEGRTVE